jgi:hypothetical protein
MMNCALASPSFLLYFSNLSSIRSIFACSSSEGVLRAASPGSSTGLTAVP